jgi:hypothetical protein
VVGESEMITDVRETAGKLIGEMVARVPNEGGVGAFCLCELTKRQCELNQLMTENMVSKD